MTMQHNLICWKLIKELPNARNDCEQQRARASQCRLLLHLCDRSVARVRDEVDFKKAPALNLPSAPARHTSHPRTRSTVTRVSCLASMFKHFSLNFIPAQHDAVKRSSLFCKHH